jgi:SAM-dependent methyltransferase
MENIFKTIIKKSKLNFFLFRKKIYDCTSENSSHYSESFSYQWSKFKKIQLDSYTNIPLSYNRLIENTKWKLNKLKNKTVLEVGSGAGRFTEIFSKTSCYLFTMDSSNAIQVNYENNKKNIKKIFFIKNEIENDIFKENAFDYVFCYGVIQHTQNPFLTLDFLINKVKINGKLSVDFYRRLKYPAWYSTPKYLWRPITKRINKKNLYKIIKFYIPIYLPIDTFLKKILKKFSTPICGLIPIPCWNYDNIDLKNNLKVKWSILDTFDALSPRYDYPLTKKEIENHLKKYKNIDYILHYGSNGIVLNLTKLQNYKMN